MRDSLCLKEIIDLYQKGYSQKNLSEMYHISVSELRVILRNNGFDTEKYRKVPALNKKIISEIIRHGFSYSQISTALDVSYHLIREIAKDNNLEGGSKVHPKLCVPVVSLNEKSFQLFIKEYKTGRVGFIKLYEKYFLIMFYSSCFIFASICY